LVFRAIPGSSEYYCEITHKAKFEHVKGYGLLGAVHQCISVNNRYLFTTGGYGAAGDRVELYDCETDTASSLATLNEGRYRHASCHFNHQFIYVFSGRASENHK